MLPPNQSVVLLGVAAFTLASCPTGDGQEAASGPRNENLKLSDLPNAPEGLAALIEKGSVTFHVGRRAPEQAERYSKTWSGRSLSAETHFNATFEYQCTSQWQVRRTGSQPSVTIRVNYQQINMRQSHEVWFRRRPATTGFWENPLVLHEFDHVRLSSDPALIKRFAEKLRARNVIKEDLPRGTRVSDSYVRGVIDRHSKQVFDEIVELINVRYKELDRQTNHGLRPLPDDSSLTEWLR